MLDLLHSQMPLELLNFLIINQSTNQLRILKSKISLGILVENNLAKFAFLEKTNIYFRLFPEEKNQLKILKKYLKLVD